jgi:hypothetical protein
MISYTEWRTEEVKKMTDFMGGQMAALRKIGMPTGFLQILLLAAIEDIHSEKMCIWFHQNREKIEREREEEAGRGSMRAVL